MAKKKKKAPTQSEFIGFLGVGLDGTDGHKRLTQADHFILLGGSEQTHERMQDTAIRFDESLKKKGKSLRETTAEEAVDLLRDALDRDR